MLPETTKILPNVKGNSYFTRMLSKKALQIAAPYLKEERSILEKFLENNPTTKQMDLCVIGAGPLFYLSSALRFASHYIGIEPNIHQFINSEYLEVLNNDRCIKIISQSFEKFCECYLLNDKRKSNTIYVFWFNVINYINDPENLLNKILKNGDVAFISGWNDSNYAKELIKMYYKFIYNDNSNYQIPQLPTLLKIGEIKSGQSHHKEIFIGKTTEIRIIYA